MRNWEKEKSIKRYRDVSDLRTQFQCEYRYYLKSKQGDQSSTFSREGIRLHNEVALNTHVGRTLSLLATIIILAVIIAA
ncbi:MAG: hypothetical protein ACFFD6_08360, partial [Candidatus Thorarchaeota archaeon]